MSRKQRIASHALASYIRMGFGALVSLAITRYSLAALRLQGVPVSATEAFGVFSLVIALSGASAFLQDAGLNALVRELARHLDRGGKALDRIFSTGVAVSAGGGLLRALILLAAAPVLPGWFGLRGDLGAWATQAFVVLGLFQALGGPLRAWNAARLAEERYPLEFLRLFVSQVIRLGMVLAARRLPGGVFNALILAWCVPEFATEACLALDMAWRDRRWRLRLADIQTKEAKHLAALGGWAAVGGAATNLFSRVDQIITTTFLGPGANSAYALADQIRLQTAQFSLVANGVLLPVASKVQSAGEAGGLHRIYVRSTRLVIGLAAGPCALVALFAPQFLGLWLPGQTWDPDTVMALRFTLGLLVLRLAVATSNTVFTAAATLRAPALAQLGEGVVNQSLSLVMVAVWHWGLAGVYLGTLVALVPRLFLVHLGQLRTAVGGPLWPLVRRAWLEPWAGGLLLLLAAWLLSLVLPALAAAAVAGLGYGAWLWWGILDQAERGTLWEILRRKRSI